MDTFEPSVLYNFVRSRQLEGTFPGDRSTGTWPTTSLRVQLGWGSPPDNSWPYNGRASGWPPQEPPGLDALAEKNRIGSYRRVRSIHDCKILLGIHGSPPVISFDITAEWYNAPAGNIPTPKRPFVGSHCVAVIGYDDRVNAFTFLNSWGKQWGDSGFGSIDYHTFNSTWIEGWAINLIQRPKQSASSSGITLVNWGLQDEIAGVLHCAEMQDSSNPVAWAFAVERDGFIDVEELFVMPAHRRRGHATALLRTLKHEIAQQQGKSLRLWIPHSDNVENNLLVIDRLLRRQGLMLHQSPYRWAAFTATPDNGNHDRETVIRPVMQPGSPFYPLSR
jgi:hypothetical protein